MRFIIHTVLLTSLKTFKEKVTNVIIATMWQYVNTDVFNSDCKREKNLSYLQAGTVLT